MKSSVPRQGSANWSAVLVYSGHYFNQTLLSKDLSQNVIQTKHTMTHTSNIQQKTLELLSSINFKTKCWHEKNNCCGSLHDKYKLHRTKIGISAALQKLLRNRNLNINRSLWNPRNNFTGTKNLPTIHLQTHRCKDPNLSNCYKQKKNHPILLKESKL